jgi:Bacterial CdiA-CT RNAse A domain
LRILAKIFSDFRRYWGVPLKGKPAFVRLFKIAIFLATIFVLEFVGCGQNPAPPAVSHQEPTAENTPRRTAERYDLARDEERGGHTLKKHVGRTDAELAERLERERNISAASTWTDLDAAETTVAEALRAERGRIESWMRRGGRRPNLALRYDAGRVIGRSLRRGESQTVECTRAVIVLRADGPDSFYVLTTYPEASE